jgi:hypothetical protein
VVSASTEDHGGKYTVFEVELTETLFKWSVQFWSPSAEMMHWCW